MNRLYLFKHPKIDYLYLAVGDKNNKRKVQLTEEQGLQLAYKLMSLCRGGETFGMEEQFCGS